MNHSEIVSFLWGVADLIRDTFKRGKYQEVIGFELNRNCSIARSTPPVPRKISKRTSGRWSKRSSGCWPKSQEEADD